jgi:tetratricopeptide (TPR) repeat protein
VPTVALVAVGVTLWRCRSRGWWRAVLFGGGFFVVALLPVLGFFDVFYSRYSFVADHFQYLASVGVIGLVCGGGAVLCERTGSMGRYVGAVAITSLLTALGTLTWRQGHIYQDSETLWRDTIAKNPQCWMAHNNLGTVFLQEGKVSDAEGEFQQALRIEPDYTAAHYNLGLALSQMGKTDKAIRQYEEALRIDPDDVEAHNNLGNALLQMGKLEQAIGQYKEALRINPDCADAHYNLGNVFLQEGNVSDAIGHYQQALRIKPDFTQAQNALARLQAGH